MTRILCSVLVATLPFGNILADAPNSKNAKVTLAYQHDLPGGRHGVSASASKSKPAKLLAMFGLDPNKAELTIPFGN